MNSCLLLPSNTTIYLVFLILMAPCFGPSYSYTESYAVFKFHVYFIIVVSIMGSHTTRLHCHVPYASVRWPDDGRKNRNMAPLKIRKTKYIVGV